MYGDAPRRAFGDVLGDIAAGTNDVRVALLDASHTKNLTGNTVFSEVNADEITNTTASDTGYTAGGQALTTKSLAHTSRVTTFDADDAVWTSSTIDAGYAVVYEDTGDATTSSLLTIVDFEGEKSSSDGEFRIEWHSDGIFQVDSNPA